jgi:hypothetical protein
MVLTTSLAIVGIAAVNYKYFKMSTAAAYIWDDAKMSTIIAAITAVLLFLSVGIGIWDFLRGLNLLDAGVVLVFIISTFLGSRPAKSP